jgi:hypothetical protein
VAGVVGEHSVAGVVGEHGVAGVVAGVPNAACGVWAQGTRFEGNHSELGTAAAAWTLSLPKQLHMNGKSRTCIEFGTQMWLPCSSVE